MSCSMRSKSVSKIKNIEVLSLINKYWLWKKKMKKRMKKMKVKR